jgi:hypothetical protein
VFFEIPVCGRWQGSPSPQPGATGGSPPSPPRSTPHDRHGVGQDSPGTKESVFNRKRHPGATSSACSDPSSPNCWPVAARGPHAPRARPNQEPRACNCRIRLCSHQERRASAVRRAGPAPSPGLRPPPAPAGRTNSVAIGTQTPPAGASGSGIATTPSPTSRAKPSTPGPVHPRRAGRR